MTDDFVSIGKYANCFNIDNDTYQTNAQGTFKIDRLNIESLSLAQTSCDIFQLEILNTKKEYVNEI